MADAPVRTPSGKKIFTYYGTGGATQRATPGWVAITGLSKEKWDSGKPNVFQTEDREMTRKIQQHSARDPGKLTATYRRVRGAADTVMTALKLAMGVGNDPIEFAVADGDITLSKTRYDRFFGKFSIIGQDRDIGKFVETDIEINEVEWYEDSALCPMIRNVAVA